MLSGPIMVIVLVLPGLITDIGHAVPGGLVHGSAMHFIGSQIFFAMHFIG